MLRISQTLALALLFVALVLITTTSFGLAASFGFTVVALTFTTASLFLATTMRLRRYAERRCGRD